MRKVDSEIFLLLPRASGWCLVARETVYDDVLPADSMQILAWPLDH